MAPKIRKSITPWFACEVCQAIVTSKDLSVHQEKSCPPSRQNWVHGYIKDNTLYSFVEEMKSQDSVKYVPKEELKYLVLLSQSALQLCDICIGEPVVVRTGGYAAVYKAWPTSEKSLTSVLMLKEAMEFMSGANDGSTHLISIGKLTTIPLQAREICLESNDMTEVPTQIPELLGRLYRGRLLLSGNKLTVPHYGRNIQFTITAISPVSSSCRQDPCQDMTKTFSEINLCNDKINVFTVLEETKWIIDPEKHQAESDKKSSGALSSIGGLNNIIIELQELMNLALGVDNPVAGLKATRGILLFGVSGVGKTLVAKALATSSKMNIITVNGPELYSKFFGETESRLQEVFNSAKRGSPSVILLDDVDSLCPSRSGGSDQEKRVVSTLLTQMDSLHETPDKLVVVLATSRQPDSLDKALRRPGRLDREVEIPVPSPEARQDILAKMLGPIEHRLTDEEVQKIAFAAHGFVGADLASLCSRAGNNAIKRNADYLTVADFSLALDFVKPSAMREVMLEVPDVRWADIGGQHGLKLQLAQAVEWPLRHPEAFARLGIPPPRGVLMFGPPGCSKTMVAKALATESKLNFLSIKGPELFSKWVGESERAVRAVFRRARQVAPAIVFFDELDALAGHRAAGGGSEGGSNVQERVLAQLLTELDGVEPLGNVVVVAATNRPDRIDKALLRPGRLDRVVYVPLPDDDTRREIFALQLRKTPVGGDVELTELVERTQGFSGAEVLAVCHEAALKALEEDLAASVVTRDHFLAALTIVTPRTPPELLRLYQDYINK